jgi:hypothetical protein
VLRHFKCSWISGTTLVSTLATFLIVLVTTFVIAPRS